MSSRRKGRLSKDTWTQLDWARDDALTELREAEAGLMALKERDDARAARASTRSAGRNNPAQQARRRPAGG